MSIQEMSEKPDMDRPTTAFDDIKFPLQECGGCEFKHGKLKDYLDHWNCGVLWEMFHNFERQRDPFILEFRRFARKVFILLRLTVTFFFLDGEERGPKFRRVLRYVGWKLSVNFSGRQESVFGKAQAEARGKFQG